MDWNAKGYRVVRWGLWVIVFPILAGGCAHFGQADVAPQPEAFGTQSPLYSGSVRAGNFLFTSGVLGTSDTGDIREGTREALGGVQERVEAGGATMADVVKCTVFLVDMEDYQGLNEVYVEFFPAPAPARSAVAVRELPAGAIVEVECIAAVL